MSPRKMLSRVLMLGLGAAAVYPHAILAQGQETSLKSVAQKAIVSNPEVLAKWHAYQAADAERDAAFGGYLPRLDVTAGIGRENRDDPTLVRDYTRKSTTVALTQMLYDGFATSSEVSRLDHTKQVRLYDLLDASENVALEAARAYFDVMRFRKLVTLAEENYVRHRTLFEQVQKKAQAGVARKVDLEQASGRLALAESNLLTETANLHDVSARYQRLVGEAPPKLPAAAPTLASGMPGDATTMLRNALSRNAAIRGAIENLRAANAAREGRKSAYHPRLDLRLKNDRGSDINGYTGSTDNRTAELVLTWNLFNGLSDYSRVRQYADQINVAKDLRDKACRDVRQTAEIAYNDTRKLNEQLVYLDQHQLSTEKAHEAYRKQFDIGQRTLLDLLDTENELFQAKRAYAIAEHDLLIAEARTQASMGNLLQALQLSRIGRDDVPEPAGWSADGDAAEQCPPEPMVVTGSDKIRLNTRAQDAMRESVLTSTAAPAGAVAVNAPAAAANGGDQDIVDALNGWSRAWQSREVDQYLGFYAPDFGAGNGRNRAAWAAERKRVITAADSIKLELADIKVLQKSPDQARTVFVQSYSASAYKDVVVKTIDWRKINGKWLIVQESAKKK